MLFCSFWGPQAFRHKGAGKSESVVAGSSSLQSGPRDLARFFRAENPFFFRLILVIFFKMAFPPGEGGHGGEQGGPEKCMTEFQKSCVTSRLLVMSRLKNFNCRRTTVLTVSTETGTPVKSGGPFLPPRQLAIFRDFLMDFQRKFTFFFMILVAGAS